MKKLKKYVSKIQLYPHVSIGEELIETEEGYRLNGMLLEKQVVENSPTSFERVIERIPGWYVGLLRETEFKSFFFYDGYYFTNKNGNVVPLTFFSDLSKEPVDIDNLIYDSH